MTANKKSIEQKIESLKQSNMLDKILIENAYEALFFYSIDGKLKYVNPAFEKITGYSMEELYNQNFITYVHPDDQEWTRKLWKGLFRGDFFEDVEYRIIKKGGQVRWSISSWKIVSDNDGEKIGIQGKQQDITDRKLAEEELDNARKLADELANKDELTGINNRRSFFKQGENVFKHAIRFEHPTSVIMMDIDYFKRINDNYGHSAGDKALQIIAQLLKETVRETDIVARIGGEEFAFILPEKNLDEAVNLIERIRLEIEKTIIVERSNPFQVTSSFGICSCSVINETLETILKKADDALYIAKNEGRNQIKIC